MIWNDAFILHTWVTAHSLSWVLTHCYASWIYFPIPVLILLCFNKFILKMMWYVRANFLMLAIIIYLCFLYIFQQCLRFFFYIESFTLLIYSQASFIECMHVGWLFLDILTFLLLHTTLHLIFGISEFKKFAVTNNNNFIPVFITLTFPNSFSFLSTLFRISKIMLQVVLLLAIFLIPLTGMYLVPLH